MYLVDAFSLFCDMHVGKFGRKEDQKLIIIIYIQSDKT